MSAEGIKEILSNGGIHLRFPDDPIKVRVTVEVLDEGNDPCAEALQELFKKVDSITTNV